MKTDKRKKLSAKKASEMSPWDVAAHYGIHYSGDMNVFDHGGYFYTSGDWMAWDYAECVEIWQDDDENLTRLNTGTINRPHTAERMERAWATMCVGKEDFDTRNNVCAHIEASRYYSGIENDASFAMGFHETQELAMWRHLLPILEDMASD